MAEELDPDEIGDALRRLLSERERAKRAVYAAHMAREKAEEERDHVQKLFDMEVAEIQKLAAENAALLSEMATLKDKERARSQVIDSITTRAEKAETREKILETILGRIEDELHDAILEEDEFDPLETVVKEGEPSIEELNEGAYRPPSIEELNETLGDPHEGPHGQEKPSVKSDMPFANFGHTFGGAIIKAALFIRPRWQVFSFAVAAPFALMTLALGLASAGVYVDELRFLWSPWPDDAVKWAVGLLGTSVFTFLPLNSLLRRRRDAAPIETPVEPVPESEYLRTIREIFGEDDDDEKDEGTPDEK